MADGRMIVFSNANVFLGKEGFVRGSLSVCGDRILSVDADGRTSAPQGQRVFPEKAQDPGKNRSSCEKIEIDLQGDYLLPGLVDIHTHGNSGCDFSDGSLEGLTAMGRYLARCGITSFAPTSMTLPYEELEKAFRTAADYVRLRPRDGAAVVGINMEGPFFSEKKKGAQNSAYLRLPDIAAFRRLQEACGNLIRIVDVAPELPGAGAFIRDAAKICRVSAAHTDASYEEARLGFEAGASHLTHLFNAMPPLHHRDPGVIGAASEREDVAAELICDGIHVHPSAVRLAFRLFTGRICLISDALRCCGMPDGDYELGGQKVLLRNGQARLEDGNLAGAATNLYEDMVNAIRFGIPAGEAVAAATVNPARAVGAEDEIGSLAPGKRADLLVCGREWELKQVFLGGERLL